MDVKQKLNHCFPQQSKENQNCSNSEEKGNKFSILVFAIPLRRTKRNGIAVS